MKNNKLKITIVAILMITVLSAVSYGAFFISRSQTKDNKLLSGCFSTSFTDSNSISMNKALPMSNSEGLNTSAYSFTISNTCSINAEYYVIIDVKTASFSDNYISYSIDGENVGVLGTSTQNTSFTVPNGYTNSYILTSGTLKQQTNITYNINIWLNDSANYTNMIEKNWGAEVRVVSLPKSATVNPEIEVVGYTVYDQEPSVNDTYDYYSSRLGTMYGADIECEQGSTIMVNSKGETNYINAVTGDHCTVNFRNIKWYDYEDTLGYHVLMDHSRRVTDINKNIKNGRRTFVRYENNLSYTDSNSKSLFKTNHTEDSSRVYYFAGNPTDNWLILGKYQTDVYQYDYFDSVVYSSTCPSGKTCTKIANAGDDIYWRIMRTNEDIEDGGIRLLYAGAGNNNGKISDVTKALIGINGNYSSWQGDGKNATGYMTENMLPDENHANWHSNIVDGYYKVLIDRWYSNYFIQYSNYLSTTAIYCNDRTKDTDSTYLHNYRMVNGIDTLKCGAEDLNGTLRESENYVLLDKFTVSVTNSSGTTIGNGKLTYPIAMITGEEILYSGMSYYRAGSSYIGKSLNGNSPYYNDFYNAPTGLASMTPLDTWNFTGVWTSDVANYMNNLNGSDYTDGMWWNNAPGLAAIVPVISLKADVKWASGDGTANSPYRIVESE